MGSGTSAEALKRPEESSRATTPRSGPVPVPAPQESTDDSSWAYPAADKRDLRIDFLRGVVMVVLVTVHIEIFSAFNFFVWERVGVVSGAEGFVILSGVVLGMVHQKRMLKDGLEATTFRLWDRAFLLYRVNLCVIGVVALMSLLPIPDPKVIMTFVDHGSKTTYDLFPSFELPRHELVGSAVLLRMGPHQFQILGLYVCLIAAAPLAMWLLSRRKFGLLLLTSWAVYFANWAFPVRPTSAQFEYAFPVLTWQLLFVHGLAYGFYRKEVNAFFAGARGTLGTVVCGVLAAGFFIFTLNNPNPALPSWSRLDLVPPETFYSLYGSYFSKNSLGFLRLVNYLAVLVVAYKVLTHFWKPLNRAFGWFLLPIGQASLYVFTVHVFVVYLVMNLPGFSELTPHYQSGNLFLNTLAHAGALLLLWTMVRHQVLYRWIPR